MNWKLSKLMVALMMALALVSACGDDTTTASDNTGDGTEIVNGDVLEGSDYASWSTAVDPATNVAFRCLWVEDIDAGGAGNWCYDPALRQALLQLIQLLLAG